MTRHNHSRWVIHFSADAASGGNPHARHHICRALSGRYRVLWVNPYGFRWPRLDRHLLTRLLRKFRGWTGRSASSAEGWVVVTPFLLPVFTESRWQSVNRWLLWKQMSRWIQGYRIERAILFFTTPRYASAVGLQPRWPAITYFSDAYSRHRELSAREQERMRAEEQMLLDASRVVFGCSMPLFRELAQRTDAAKVVHFPHQLETARFLDARARHGIPAELQKLPRPLIGYYGTLTDSNDWATLKYAAERRPAYSFVLIGRKEISDTGLEGLPNVHFLGPKPYSQIPAYGAAFDVAVMFWVVRDWIRYCSPLKLREYLALGLPVVSTWIEDVAECFGDIVAVTRTPEEFLAALDRRLNEPDPAAVRRGQERVLNDSWDKIRPYFDQVWTGAFGDD